MSKQINNDRFKLVTDSSMSLVNKKDIVLPSTYRVVFASIAKKYNLDIGAENMHTNEEINEDVYKHILSIDNNANRAIEAIQSNDTTELKHILEDTEKLKEEVEALKQISYEDGLTRVFNRRWFEENYLNKEDETFNKNGILVFIDLNDFKQINDNLGHATGDKVLMYFSSRLKKLNGDVIRYGGDEFAIIFQNESYENVKNTIHILRELHLKKKYKILNNVLKIKFAYGIVEFNTNDNFSDIIKEADINMYEDKEKVKSR